MTIQELIDNLTIIKTREGNLPILVDTDEGFEDIKQILLVETAKGKVFTIETKEK